VLLLVLISVIKYLIYVMIKVICDDECDTVVVVASMSTTDVWRGMTYC